MKPNLSFLNFYSDSRPGTDPANRNSYTFSGLIVLLLFALSINLYGKGPAPYFTIGQHRIIINNQDHLLKVSLNCPYFVLDNQIVGGYSPKGTSGDIRNSVKTPFSVSYGSVNLNGDGKLDINLHLQWSPEEMILHKWVTYRFSYIESPVLVKEIILDSLEAINLLTSVQPGPGQSYPVFLPGFFAGIEFPVSSVRMESGLLVMAHQPGLRIMPGRWYDSRKEVFGIANKGHEKEAFISYIAANRPAGSGMHIDYNSWWTSPMPYSEKDILKLMNAFYENMFLPYGVSFNSFCIDMGWSNPKSIWGIDTILFPDKFTTLRQAAEKMNTNLGLWISPSNRYSPSSINSDWAEQNGYETFIDTSRSAKVCCLGGEHYSNAFREKLLYMVKEYGIKQLKFDGYLFLCPRSDHGHEPGILSMEPIAESLIETCRQIHKVSPDTWIETTCMGWNPSPWWLFNANSVIGTYGDDSPAGRVPSPVFRESYTSARDFYNIQGATYLMSPVSAQEVLGIIHQTPEPFANDAITTIMRGHLFLPLYVNPAYMDKTRWKMLAYILTWARQNVSFLRNTKILLPESWKNGNVPRFSEEAQMPREPYGYSHWFKNKGLVELRNPWIKSCEYALKIDSTTGFSKNAGNLKIVSLYPEVRIYARNLNYGELVNIPLAPYETLILSVSAEESIAGLMDAETFMHAFGKIVVNSIKATDMQPVAKDHSYTPDSVSKSKMGTSTGKYIMEGSVELKSGLADLTVIIEDKNDSVRPTGDIYINGKPSAFSISGTASGWKATMFKKQEHWTIISVPLEQGKNEISFKLNILGAPGKVSVWAWAKKPGNRNSKSYPNVLPQPEEISLESVKMVESFPD